MYYTLVERRSSAEDLMLLNCGGGEDSWGSLGLQGDQILKEINLEYSSEGLWLKLHYCGHLMQKRP